MKGPFIGYKNFGLRFFLFLQFTRLTEGRTDGHFAHRAKTALHRCSAVKTSSLESISHHPFPHFDHKTPILGQEVLKIY